MPRGPHPEHDDSVASSLELAIEHAVDALDRTLSALRSELRLSPIECSMIRLLAREDWSIGSLARASGHGRSSVSMAARRLEDRGFLACAREGGRTRLTLAAHVRRDFFEAYRAPLGAAIATWAMDRPDVDVHAVLQLTTSIVNHADDQRMRRSRRDIVDQLADAMLRGDHAACFDLARPLIDDGAPGPSYDALLDALHVVTQSRQCGDADLLDEQVATAAARRTVDRLHGLTCHARAASRVALVGMLGGQADDLHPRMVMNELERTGWDVLTVPRAITPDELGRLYRRARPDSIVFTFAPDSPMDHAIDLVGALGRARPILVGARGTCDTQLESIGAAVDGRIAPSIDTIAQLALPNPGRRAA